MKRYSINDLDIRLKPLEGKKWELFHNLTYELSDGKIIRIPKGFKTDLSSVPLKLWGLFPPFGDFLPAALVHDYLYVIRYNNDRAFADKEMLRISDKFHSKTRLNRLDNYLRYYAVRLFGWIYWNDKNKNG